MAGKAGAHVPKTSKSGKSPSGGIDWMMVGAVVVVVALVAGLAIYLVPRFLDKRAEEEAARIAPETISEFVPTPANPDPSDKIEGIVKRYYPAATHTEKRVAYDQSPPFGGPHDAIWATCTGIVYPNPIRSENAVHALEHGSVWITYNPDTISSGDLDYLKNLVRGEQYLFMSPYPGLSTPLSLQSWGHQLKLDSAKDPRVNQFITALRRNPMTNVYRENPQASAYPEVQATCGPTPGFDPSNPPPADQGPPGPDAFPMDGKPAAPVTQPMPTG
ncbi:MULTISPECIES: DUF3105 domain-containing protein [unclassified Gordonia (in: high G+C Gram-positive bacteria)]|uniref:DUF3105 domain-containing protein n=1 Tax=unclassified Gordonia (in: high G+C Gram-positive bacteria) TaxID=2657482 RepID=UPI001F0EFE45|nr:DUF3105 domain-containing protein [Gordonia sp. ABSL49_1]MCH5644360.1 DUF3105 domain-containing protein [Gordonia sp. ABSL49_1]